MLKFTIILTNKIIIRYVYKEIKTGDLNQLVKHDCYFQNNF